MKINNVIVDECIGNEMKFFVKEGNVEDVENRWFSWSEVIGMVLKFKFEKGVVYGLLFMVCCLWFVVYGLLFMVCCLWFVVYGLLFMVCCLWFVDLS